MPIAPRELTADSLVRLFPIASPVQLGPGPYVATHAARYTDDLELRIREHLAELERD